MITEVVHPGRANVPRAELQEKVAAMYKATTATCVVLFGFKTAFGGGKSSGFCLIYDDEAALKKFEPKHRQIRAGVKDKKDTARKSIKETKNRNKKFTGTGASIAKHKAKRAANAD
jgi:small subunit ribosomal protein S24e